MEMRVVVGGGGGRGVGEQCEVLENPLGDVPVPAVQGDDVGLRADGLLVEELDKVPGGASEELNKGEHLLTHLVSVFADHSVDAISGDVVDVVGLVFELPGDVLDQSDDEVDVEFLLELGFGLGFGLGLLLLH